MSVDEKYSFLVLQVGITKIKNKPGQINIKQMMNYVDERVKQHEMQSHSQHSRKMFSE